MHCPATQGQRKTCETGFQAMDLDENRCLLARRDEAGLVMLLPSRLGPEMQ